MGQSKGDGRTRIEQPSEREFVVTRTFDAPVRLVFEAWTKPDLFKLWWAPKSIGMALVGCEMDVRTGGGYRLEFRMDGDNTMEFFGKYLEVAPPSRIVWTNDENETGSVTTVTFEDRGDRTLLTLHELYPSKEALEAEGGAVDGLPEQFAQLDELLASQRAKV